MKLDFFTAASRPADEAARQAEVDALPLETIADPRLDAIVEEAQALLGTPMVALSIIDDDRQLFVSRSGLAVRETSRAVAICAHGLDGDRSIRDYGDLAVDRRFRHNPLVTTDLRLRAYVGAPLVTDGGHALGALCGLDTVPRPAAISPEVAERLQELADRAVAILGEHRRPA